MTKVLIIGGKLQGTEAAYLAKKAGFYTIVLDRNKNIPAAGLADKYIREDVFRDEYMVPLFSTVDVVIPAVENRKVLQKILEYGQKTHKRVIYDDEAYRISSSKKLSNELFTELALPVPGKYPGCQFPVIVKPDGLSGSRNVRVAFSAEDVERALVAIEGEAVIEEYLEGRSFSMEVIGDGKRYFLLPVTEVITDGSYDCKRIIAPAQISSDIEKQFQDIAAKLAQRLMISGIFDIEVICHKGVLKVLEIDARLPSQTPISIYHASGLNMIKVLAELALGIFSGIQSTKKQVCCYQQIEVDGSFVQVLGEHIMTACENLTLLNGFFGADEGITDYRTGSNNWKAILVITADTWQKAYSKFLFCVNNIIREHGDLTLKEG